MHLETLREEIRTFIPVCRTASYFNLHSCWANLDKLKLCVFFNTLWTLIVVITSLKMLLMSQKACFLWRLEANLTFLRLSSSFCVKKNWNLINASKPTKWINTLWAATSKKSHHHVSKCQIVHFIKHSFRR